MLTTTISHNQNSPNQDYMLKIAQVTNPQGVSVSGSFVFRCFVTTDCTNDSPDKKANGLPLHYCTKRESEIK